MDWKEYQHNWYLTHKEQLKQWRDENRDYINENARNYYKRNRDKLIEYNKQRYRDKMRALKENPELHEQQKLNVVHTMQLIKTDFINIMKNKNLMV